MKVLLVRPPFRCFWGMTPGYPLSIGLLAACLREKVDNIDVDFLDFEFMDVFSSAAEGDRAGGRLSLIKNYLISEYSRIMTCQQYWESVHTGNSPIWEEMSDAVLEQVPDIVAIQCYTVNMTAVKILSDLIKKRNSGVKIVLGGPHIALRAEETINVVGGADYCIEGNAFEALPLIVAATGENNSDRLRDIPGIWYKERGQGIQSRAAPSPVAIDVLPFADRFLGDVSDYAPVQHIFTSLGCPWQCAYCSAHKINRGGMVLRSMENVVEELKQLNAQGFKNFRITDDTFTYDKKRVKQFVALVNAAGLSDLSFSFGARVDTVDEELLEIVSDLKVTYISIGVEAGSDRVLAEVMRKKVTTAQIIKAFDLLRRYKFETMAFFILGNPGERMEEMMASYDLVRKIRPTQAIVAIASPLPETGYGDWATRKGLEFTIDNYYKLSSLSPFAHNLSAVSGEALDRMYQKFHRRALKNQNRERIKRWLRLLIVNPGLVATFITKKIRFFKQFGR